MITTVSPKYQIVIPKAVRKQLNIKRGQKMNVEVGSNDTIVVKPASEHLGLDELRKYAGSIKTSETKWGKQGLDPTTWIREQRDKEWR